MFLRPHSHARGLEQSKVQGVQSRCSNPVEIENAVRQ
jgi:hypothetical protein